MVNGHAMRGRAGKRARISWKEKELKANPITGQVAAISCGVYEKAPVLDLD